MDKGPLDHPRLRAIDQKLNEGDLDGAQRALGSLGDVTIFLYATTYLATRLLYLRGRLSDGDVIERLEELISRAGYFPEAEAMLLAAQSGTLADFRSLPEEEALPTAVLSSGADEGGKPHPPKRTPSDIGFRRLAAGEPMNAATPSVRSMPAIPRAARLPEFGPGIVPRLETPVPPPSDPPVSKPAGAPSTRPAPARDGSPQRAAPPGADGCSLAELAALLDEGRAAEVLCALDGPAEALGPEHALLRGRALKQAGYGDKAIRQLERLSNAPLLDPQIRVEVARLLLQLGRPALAHEQADAAFKDDPDALLGRLT
ncbi:MAG TPA: hypothetical protein VKZ49_08350, partial [Polyangiaceae bacterium]|nr:hypothetical protein [Polyangiaceae bacterium]